MPTPASPLSPKPPGDAVPVGANPGDVVNPALSPVDEQLHGFWKKNGQAILVLCGIVVVFYIGKAGWDAYSSGQEAGVEKEFAEATTPEKLQAFTTAHSDNILAGIAQLQIGDTAYAAGRMVEAVSGYSQAVNIIKSGPLFARAQLGLAMAKIQSGATSEGEATLHRLAEDPKSFEAIRTESYYQLASLAAAAGRADEVQRLGMQVMQINPNSPWAQRAFALQAQLPPPTAPVVPAGPAIPPSLAAPVKSPVPAKPSGP
jgi:predicted negative regulator of RcsB-dependent stress response